MFIFNTNYEHLWGDASPDLPQILQAVKDMHAELLPFANKPAPVPQAPAFNAAVPTTPYTPAMPYPASNGPQASNQAYGYAQPSSHGAPSPHYNNVMPGGLIQSVGSFAAPPVALAAPATTAATPQYSQQPISAATLPPTGFAPPAQADGPSLFGLAAPPPALTLATLPPPGAGLPDFSLTVKIMHIRSWGGGTTHVKHVFVWDGTGHVNDYPLDQAVENVLSDIPLSGTIRPINVWQAVFGRFPEVDAVPGAWVRFTGLLVKNHNREYHLSDVASRDALFSCVLVPESDPIVQQRLAAAASSPAQRMPPSHLQITDAYVNAPSHISIPSAHTTLAMRTSPAMMQQQQYQALGMQQQPYQQVQYPAQPPLYANSNKRGPGDSYAGEPPAAKRIATMEMSREIPSANTPASEANICLPVDPLITTTSERITIRRTGRDAPITYASKAKGKLTFGSEISELFRVRGYLKYVWPRPSKCFASDFIRTACSTCHAVQQAGAMPMHVKTCQGRQYVEIIYFVLKIGDDSDTIDVQVSGSAAEMFMGRNAKTAKADLAAFHRAMKMLEREIGTIADFFVVARPAARDSESHSFMLFGTEFNHLLT